MKILVTGGAGYIGSHTCVELLNEGYEVVIVDNLYNSNQKAVDRIEQITQKKVTFYQNDILDREALDQIFTKENVDAVIHFAGLKAVNPDVIAWIQIPALDISYPVVQGKDNAYYLHHLFSGESNINGSIFVDCHNQPDFTDQNTIVYGHNMKNGSMFGTLDKYQDKELFEQHPEFYLYLPDKILKYRIFSCYAGRTGSEGYRYHFPEAEDFQTFLDTVSSYRDYDTGTELSATDRIVTLSTCVNSRRNYRYLVHGKLSSEIITEE